MEKYYSFILIIRDKKKSYYIFMNKAILSILFLCCGAFCMNAAAQTYHVESPDGQLSVIVKSDGQLRWSIAALGTLVMEESAIGLQWSTPKGKPLTTIGSNMPQPKVAVRQVSNSFATPFYKKARVEDNYGEMVVYAKDYRVEFRAYDDGAAYRIILNKKGDVTVNSEQAEFRFTGDYPAFIPYVNDTRGGERYSYSFESLYDEVPLSKMYADSLAITPLAVCLPDGKKVVVMDAGVENYPGMMLLKGQGNCLVADFAPYVLEEKIGGFDQLNLEPTRRANYIAELRGKGEVALPWRAVVVTKRDADLLNCDMAQRLARPCSLSDTSWIRPGKVAWDWWNNLNLTGVDFKTGMNTATYKYYIDFAAKNHLEYIIIDEGWSGKESLMENLSTDIDLPELIRHANAKGVGIILWSSWRCCIKDMDRTFAHYAQMGIKGFKVDFFDRDDQAVIRSAYAIAECAAKHHLLLDLHGLKPFGIQRTYPNIMNFEGVKGLENNKWEPRTSAGPVHDFPRYDVSAPYLRMLAGPMDYTPGAMTNATRDCYFGNNNHPMSQGTRVHQMAMYVMYEAPLQMLADSPSKYMKEQECTNFIAAIPTTCDETVALDGELGRYAVVARRKGSTWYVGALTDWTERDLQIDLSFLGNGSHQAVIFADGTNAAKEATDYRRSEQTLTSADRLTIHLAPGGGWTAIIR